MLIVEGRSDEKNNNIGISVLVSAVYGRKIKAAGFHNFVTTTVIMRGEK